MPDEQVESNFDYQGAIASGYNDEEILDYLSKEHPDFDVNSAFSSGYSASEINDYLSKKQVQNQNEERSAVEKGLRLGAQYGLGAVSGSVPGMVYDIGVSPLASKSYLSFNERVRLGEESEYLAEKNAGKPFDEWSDQDKQMYESIERQIKPGGQLETVPEGVDLTIKGLAKKATGIDFTPEDTAEKAVEWMGFIRDPKRIFSFTKGAVGPKDVFKAVSPTGKEFLRGAGAGIAMQIAEDGGFGPIGVLAATIVGDMAGSGAKGILKTGAEFLSNSKQALASVAASMTKKDQIALQQQIIADFRNSGIQADIGTLTDSELLKWIQARLKHSGLTGDALDALQKETKDQILSEYKHVADSLGAAKFQTTFEAGTVAKQAIKDIRDADMTEVRSFYNLAENSLKKDAKVDSFKVLNAVQDVEQNLIPGKVKSQDQKAVLNIMQDLKSDILDASGKIKDASVKDLINNKIALNDIINYETQEGVKKLLRNVVGEIDRTIISHGKDNPTFAKNYIKANQRFSEHAKTFRNKRVASLLKDNDPATLLNKMNSIQGIRDLEKILSKTKEGRELMTNLKRFKLDDVIGNNMVDNITQQIKLGTFTNVLNKPKNRDIIREMLPRQSFQRLERLQRNTGRLAESAQKFMNTSKSGTVAADFVIVSKIFSDIMQLLSGNPFPLAKSATGVGGARYLTNLMGDPKFLKLVEDAMLAAQQNNVTLMDKLAQEIVAAAKPAIARSMGAGG